MSETRAIIADIAIQQLMIAVALVDRWANKAPTEKKSSE